MSRAAGDPFDFASDPRNQLNGLIEAERVGSIEGVLFDLRHDSIPSDAWHAPDAAYGIELLFPSERVEDEGPSLLREDETAWVQAEAGDAVSIESLRRFDRHEGPLADRHDTEEWWATLRLTRAATGQQIRLEGVMCFVPRDALGPHSPHLPSGDDDYANYVAQHLITFEKIGRRIRRLSASTQRREPAMWANVDGFRARIFDGMLPLLPPDTEVEHGWVYEPPFGPAREWLALADNSYDFASDEADAFREGAPLPDLEALIDTVAAAAYALARAECELRITPLAKNTLKSIEGGAQGGRKSAENRRAWVAKHWEPHALELARALREKTPSLGQTDLAAEILFAWTSEVAAPGHDWTLGFVRAAERQGLLPRRKRNVAARG